MNTDLKSLMRVGTYFPMLPEFRTRHNAWATLEDSSEATTLRSFIAPTGTAVLQRPLASLLRDTVIYGWNRRPIVASSSGVGSGQEPMTLTLGAVDANVALAGMYSGYSGPELYGWTFDDQLPPCFSEVTNSPDSSTAPYRQSLFILGAATPYVAPSVGNARQLPQTVLQLFLAAATESFEAGMNSGLSVGIEKLLMSFGPAAIAAMTEPIRAGLPCEDVAAEALRTIGRVHQQATRMERLALLLQMLEHRSYFLRDAALTGLAYANDPSVIPHLEALTSSVAEPVFAEDLHQLMADLRS